MARTQLFPEERYDAYDVFFRTLVSEHRLNILNTLKHGALTVTELCARTGLEQSALSHHLARLRRCGFVTSEVKGRYRSYRVNEDTISPLLDLIDDHMRTHCVHLLHAGDDHR